MMTHTEVSVPSQSHPEASAETTQSTPIQRMDWVSEAQMTASGNAGHFCVSSFEAFAMLTVRGPEELSLDM